MFNLYFNYFIKYKLITLPEGTLSLPYITNLTQVSGDNKLESIMTDSGWVMTDFTFNPITVGAEGSFTGEKYSWLVLNSNVIDIKAGSIPTDGTFASMPDTGVSYGEETGRLSKKVISTVATIQAKQMIFDRETSIIVTGQRSGAIYVIKVQVGYVNNQSDQ